MISFPIIKKIRKSLERTSKGQIQGREIGSKKAGYLKTDYVRFSCPALTRTEFELNRTDFRIDETKQCNQNCFWWWGLKCQTTSRFPPEQKNPRPRDHFNHVIGKGVI